MTAFAVFLVGHFRIYDYLYLVMDYIITSMTLTQFQPYSILDVDHNYIRILNTLYIDIIPKVRNLKYHSKIAAELYFIQRLTSEGVFQAWWRSVLCRFVMCVWTSLAPRLNPKSDPIPTYMFSDVLNAGTTVSRWIY